MALNSQSATPANKRLPRKRTKRVWMQVAEVAEVAEVARELSEARKKVAEGLGEEAVLVGRIHERFTYRMHDLSEFMKGFMQRYTQWHNRTHKRKILVAGAGERVEQSGEMRKITKRKGLTKEELDAEKQRLIEAAEKQMAEIPFGRMMRCRVRYFTDEAVIGSRDFVNAAFESARDRFGPRRRNGARKLRGSAGAAADLLWSLRDLQKT